MTSQPGRLKFFFYWGALIIVTILFISFLVAFIVEKNKTLAPNVISPSSTVAPVSSTVTPIPEDEIRLNDQVQPENYRLTIRSDPNQKNFSGIVRIALKVIEDDVQQIKIHCKNLEIIQYKLEDGDGKSIEIVLDSDEEVRNTTELCSFDLKTSIGKGSYSFNIDYNGYFKNGQITGFYRSSYKTLENQIKYLTSTKFEPTYARMAFPCFDEPKFKATFDIILEHPATTKAISNQIEKQKTNISTEWISTEFEQTVKMSTYLVAFVISDFEFTETQTKSGLPVRVYSRPDQVKKTNYALDTAAQILDFYENFTNIPYSMKKLDLIGLPEFVSGAMENYGLVTYKETYVLYDEQEFNAADMKSVASVIAHELAHMWFGNLVTMEWWSDIWLNEGFASYFEYYGQNHVNKSWNIFSRLSTGDIQSAIKADSLENAHPLVKPVITPDQITAMFDTISYSKGAAIVHMIEKIIGREAFQKSIQNYLNENQYGNVDSSKMIKYFSKEIKKATDVDGEVFLKKWIFNNGYPIVTVKRVSNDNSKLDLEQIAYFNQAVPEEPWNVFVTYRLPHNRQGSFVFNKTSQTITLNNEINDKQWIKLNNNGTDYYLVKYSDKDNKLLVNELKLNLDSFTPSDRASILFDAYHLSEISMYSYENLFHLFDYLEKETHYLPWSIAYNALSSLNKKLASSNGDSLIRMKNYIQDLVKNVYDSFVSDSFSSALSSYDQIALRNTIINTACFAEYEKCLEQCQELFRNWLDNGSKIDSNIKSYVYKFGLKASTNEADWNKIWDRYQSEKDANEKTKLMTALTSTRSTTLLSLLISYSQNQSLINNENFFSVQQNIASNSEMGRSLIWDYIKNNWVILVERFGLNDRRLGNYVKSVVSGFGTKLRLAEVEQFFSANPEAGAGEAARKDAIELIKKNILWLEKNEKNVSESLETRDQIKRPWLNWRLDQDVIPLHYDLNLTINVDDEVFNGSVNIQLETKRPIKYIVLHALNLNITFSEVFTEKSLVQVSSSNSSFSYKNNQYWIIPMVDYISLGVYNVKIAFNSQLSFGLNGLYLSRYKNPAGNYSKLVTTQFESTYARKAFPCFDEPGFKSTFKTSIEHSNQYSALSNMPVDYVQKTSGSWLQTVFKKSVKMSTYLVALIVSDFVSKSNPTVSNFSVYTYNPNVNLDKVDYSLDIGPKILSFYESTYFQISYPLPKMDMISIPDFLMGAMENWGLVTYRDVYLLYDKKKSSSSSKMTICSIIAHELAHMWFGNLVTMKWWDDLWLNEGFAQFMQYKATAFVEPTWNYQEHFVMKELSRVFEADSSLTTHSILTKVNNENDIQSVFDSVTYAKGASVIRMLENTLGEETFQTGIINYLKKNSFKNTVTSDLWNELTNVASNKFNVGSFMDTWITKEGFPVVTISISSKNTFLFEQERFLKDFSSSTSNYLWNIPLTYRVINMKYEELTNEPQIFYFDTKKLSKSIDLGQNEFIKFNIDHKGVYVVNYDTDTWNSWIKELNDNSSIIWKKLSSMDRHNLLLDAFYLSRSGRLSYDISLKLAEFLKHERSLIVWQAAISMLNYLRPFLITQDKGIAFENWILTELINPSIYQELGWKDEQNSDDPNRKQLRASILDIACLYGHQDCLKTAKEKFEEYQKDPTKPADQDLFSIILFYTMRNSATTENFEFLEKQYSNTSTTEEKMIFLRALCAVQDSSMLQKLMNNSLDETFLKSQDFFTFLNYLSSNPVGLPIAWKFYQDNYQTILDRYGLDDSNLGRAVYRFAYFFNTDKQREEVVSLFNQFPEAGASQLYRKQTLELIDSNLAWSKSYYNKLIEFVTNKCDDKTCPWNVYRLNPNVVPKKYDLTIQVNTTTFQYNGTVLIDVEIKEEISHLILHASEILDVLSISFRQQGNDLELSKEKGFRYSKFEFFVVPLNRKVSNGIYSITASFNGSLLLAGLSGIYRSYYETENGTVNLAATQLESTSARKVFPGFDEPAFKHEIDIKVIHDKKMNTTLSNMDIKESKPHESMFDWVVTQYRTTPKMVTYLIAILVSDFKCTGVNVTGLGESSSLPIQTCASPLFETRKHRYSLEVTPKILKHFESYTNIPYKFPKLDQVAIPHFSAGAMENWGLVKYRETMLLWTDDEETSAQQRSVCSVIAHELAHMWFGNLVTCQFWGDLWLNEAFASYMEFSATDFAHPEWNYFDTVTYYDTMNAMLGDSSESSKPIVTNVTSPELMSYSSSIVYNKGSVILHMFNWTMSPEKFQNSLQTYLKDNSFTSIVTSSLFDVFEKNWIHPEKMKASDFLDFWVKKPGFPYVNITYDKQNQKIFYSQQRFLQNGMKPSKEYVYPIPFSFYTLDSKNQKTFNLKQADIQFLNQSTGTLNEVSNFIKANPNFFGFYLVNYNDWDSLIEKMVKNDRNIIQMLTVNDRAELLFSSFLLARAKLTSYLTPFKLFQYLVHETHFVPWYFYSYASSALISTISRTEYRDSIMLFEQRIVSVHYKNNFWDDALGTNIDKSFRLSIISYACRSGLKSCLEDAYEKFTLWKSKKKLLEPNLRSNILNYGIQYSKNEDDYKFVWNKYIAEKSTSSLKSIYLESLAYISDSEKLKTYIKLSLNETLVPMESFVSFFNKIIENYSHEKMIWSYFLENKSMLSRKLSSSFNKIVSKFADYATSLERKNEINSFFQNDTKYSYTSKSFRITTLKTIENNLQWLSQYKTLIGEWFAQNACGSDEKCLWSQLRINSIVKPIKYDLIIQVNLTTNIYNGSVNIDLIVENDFDTLVLHAADTLKVKLASMKNSNSIALQPNMFRYKPLDYIVLRFNEKRGKGNYSLNFTFEANMLDSDLSGLYISTYSEEGKDLKIASTQFEFHDARKVFPCLDEPAFKSSFIVTIIHDINMKTTLSNMEVDSTELIPERNWTKTKFKESKQMTTYLVAIVVSDFVCVQSEDKKYRVCASEAQKHKMNYALEKASTCLEHLEETLDFAYPLNKTDLIAIPDFRYGAMENWGLVTFRESALLFNETDTTTSSKMSILNTIAHELAHFWFGNLVTCDWWENFFLNEAFATYMQFTTVNKAEPEWDIFNQFLMSHYEVAVTADSVENDPLVRTVNTTDKITQFDSNIIYSKGATILRMVEFMMGTEQFYSALKDYLKTYQYKNVNAKNLLEKFDQHSETSLKMSYVLEEWLYKNGFPYINVTKIGDKYELVQKQYLIKGTTNNKETIWKIPVSYYTDDSFKKTTIQFLENKTTTLDYNSASSLFKLNAGQNGFYLVNYPLDIWNSIILNLTKSFEKKKLPILDRAGLLLDAFYLSRASLLSYSIPLSLTGYLKKENHITPWTIAIRGLNSIKTYIDQGSLYRLEFRSYLQELVQPIYTELKWNDTGKDIERSLRNAILNFACTIQLDDCLKQSHELFSQWIKGKQTNNTSLLPPPNLLEIVLKNGIKTNSSRDDWLYIWSQYQVETSATLKSIYINALSNTVDQKQISMLLNQALEAEVIRSQDSYSVLNAIVNSNNPDSLQTLWQFFQDNYEKMFDSSSTISSTQVASLLNSICSKYFFSQTNKTEVQNFLNKYPSIGLTESQRQAALSTIDSNIEWMNKRMVEVERFLLCGSDDCPFTVFRLNPKVEPTNYKLYIKVDLDKEQYNGSVEIDVLVNETISFVVLSAASSLSIKSSQVENVVTRNQLEIEKSFPYKAFDFWVLKMKNQITANSKLKLKFEFESKLANDMTGFYLGHYYDPQRNATIKLASTQFQATSARQVFPCFDYPEFKSIFEVSIEHQSDYSAISNNKVKESRKLDSDSTVTTFEKSPKMVTYLVAFVVSDFENKENKTTDGNVLVRVWSSPPEINNTQYSLTKSPDLIKAFEQRFDYSYQLPKMDLVAITDFSAGAMENWGLLTFRETALLWNEKTSSAADKMSVVAVVAHEIAHMWFGNLLTCQWWTDLWLNEAFASYLEWFSVDQVEPDWKYKQLFYVTDYISGMNADASNTAHPLIRPSINSPGEIPYISNIIYQKGSSILRMFEFVLSEKEFYDKLKLYLKENEYTSLNSSILLSHLSKIQVNGLSNTTTFLESWTMKPGFPYLNITMNNETLTVVQQRFLSNGRLTDESQVWIVPLSYYSNYNVSADFKTIFIENKTANFENFTVENSELPIKFNYDSLGFYIVNYPIEEWKKWVKLFKDELSMKNLILTSQDYSQLLLDAFRLANVDLLSFDIAIDLLSILNTNEMFSVWSTGSTILNQLWSYFKENDNSTMGQLMNKEFETFALNLVQNVYKKYNLQNVNDQTEPIVEQRLRSTVVAFACLYGSKLCLSQAQTEFQKWRTLNTDLSPNVMSTVLRYAIQESKDESDWYYLWDVYARTHQTVLKLRYLEGLAQTTNEKLLNVLFENANNQSLVRRQDYLSLYRYVLRTSVGFQVGWNYFKNNYRNLLKNRLSKSQIGTLANYFAQALYKTEQRSEFSWFFAEHSDTGISSINLNKALETIDSNIAWVDSYKFRVYDRLRVINRST